MIRTSSFSLISRPFWREIIAILLITTCSVFSETKHQKTTSYPEYSNLIMAGYQGWFRAEGDGSKRGWGHYGVGRKFDYKNNTIDMWPDMSEYEKTYETSFQYKDGKMARVFSSVDKSTTDLHFRWMKEYGVDGVFMQRFFPTARDHRDPHKAEDNIIRNALNAAKENQRAIALMYDLSGLRAKGEDCSAVIEDWKMLVDELKITQQGDRQTYLYHNDKPLVAIWGVGFPDRPYNIRTAGINRLIDFLKNDPVYGGCSVMLGIPTYFRDLNRDCVTDPYLHTLIDSVDIVMPWMVQRFTPLVHDYKSILRDHIADDIAWCKERGVDYVPVISPGFSWRNLSLAEDFLKPFRPYTRFGAIPRLGGVFYWDQLMSTMQAGADRVYVAMFDEIDEGTAIMKVTDTPPVSDNAFFVDNDGMPSDQHLWLTGEAAKILRKEAPIKLEMPKR